jgi:hypothetical protein
MAPQRTATAKLRQSTLQRSVSKIHDDSLCGFSCTDPDARGLVESSFSMENIW